VHNEQDFIESRKYCVTMFILCHLSLESHGPKSDSFFTIADCPSVLFFIRLFYLLV